MTTYDPATPIASGLEPIHGPIVRPFEPWEAVCWSFVIPGLGHVLQGERARGVAALAIVAGLALMAAVMLVTPGLPVLPGWIALGLAFVADAVVAWDAFRWAARRESASARIERRTNRDPWKALLLTNLLVGVGQMYDGRWPIGLLFLVAFSLLANRSGAGFHVATDVVGFAACVEMAFRSRGPRALDRRRALGWIAALAVASALTALTTFTIRAILVQAYDQPGEGMLPTLRKGDHFFVDRTSRGHAALGDVIVFPMPGKPGTELSKRVFAREGDLVEFRSDGAWRNGHREIEPPLASPGTVFPIGAEGAPFRVPAGMVFVLGDNITNSLDSRAFGPISERDVRGRAYKIYAPPGREHALDRRFPAR